MPQFKAVHSDAGDGAWEVLRPPIAPLARRR